MPEELWLKDAGCEPFSLSVTVGSTPWRLWGEKLVEFALEWEGSLIAFTCSSVTVGSTAAELPVVLGKGPMGDLIAGDGEAEAFEDILADFEESLEPFTGPVWLGPSW